MTTPYAVPFQLFKLPDSYGNAQILLNAVSHPSLTYLIDPVSGLPTGRQILWPKDSTQAILGKLSVPDVGAPITLDMVTIGHGDLTITFFQNNFPTTDIMTGGAFVLTGANSFSRALSAGGNIWPWWSITITPSSLTTNVQITSLIVNA